METILRLHVLGNKQIIMGFSSSHEEALYYTCIFVFSVKLWRERQRIQISSGGNTLFCEWSSLKPVSRNILKSTDKRNEVKLIGVLILFNSVRSYV